MQPEATKENRMSTAQTQRSSVSIIVVSYNTVELLRDCLASVYAQCRADDEVLVVDNASRDGSVEMVKKEFADTVLLESQSNLGFAKANNHAISKAAGELLWFLNPDARLEPGALDAAVAFMNRNRSVGMAGTALIHPDGSPQPSVEYGYPGQTYAGSLFDGLPGKIAWVVGASIFAWRRVMDTVGGFDERFFLYGEDLDLGLTVRKAGWPIGFIKDSVVTHYGGESERSFTPEAVIEKKLKGEMIFYRKHYPRETIHRIKRKNRIQAAWRLITLYILRLLVPNNPTVARKYSFYLLSWRFFGKSNATL